MPLPVEGSGGEIRSNPRYVVPENSDQGASINLELTDKSWTKEVLPTA